MFTKESRDLDKRLKNPPCWRDSMLMKSGYFFSIIMQAFIVHQFAKTNIGSYAVTLDRSIQFTIYEDFVDAWRNAIYMADKCKMEQQGGFNMYKEMDILLEDVWRYSDKKMN